MKHIAGNQLSRWTASLTTDGEKVSRNRDTEFEEDTRPRAEILERWERGWAALGRALDGLGPDDLQREVTIRGRSLTVIQAIENQVQHYGYHTGQIAYAARMPKRDDWVAMSIPRGGSDAHNRSLSSEPR